VVFEWDSRRPKGEPLHTEKVRKERDSLRQARDDKHPLSRLVVSGLGDANLATRKTTNLVDLGASASDDASTAKTTGAKNDNQRPTQPKLKSPTRTQGREKQTYTMSLGIEIFCSR
jgi:hypothetical protein